MKEEYERIKIIMYAFHCPALIKFYRYEKDPFGKSKRVIISFVKIIKQYSSKRIKLPQKQKINMRFDYFYNNSCTIHAIMRDFAVFYV